MGSSGLIALGGLVVGGRSHQSLPLPRFDLSPVHVVGFVQWIVHVGAGG